MTAENYGKDYHDEHARRVDGQFASVHKEIADLKELMTAEIKSVREAAKEQAATTDKQAYEVKDLRSATSQSKGTREGISATVAMGIAIAALLVGLFSSFVVKQ